VAKRFTDNEKWADIWFRKLPVHLKCFWFYILDKCDVAGVWKVDLESASFHLNHDLKEQEIKGNFEGRISFFNDKKWFVDGFIDFQYGTLREGCNPHKPVIKIIEDLKKQGYLKGSQTLKDKDQAQDQDQYKAQYQDRAKENIPPPSNPEFHPDSMGVIQDWLDAIRCDITNARETDMTRIDEYVRNPKYGASVVRELLLKELPTRPGSILAKLDFAAADHHHAANKPQKSTIDDKIAQLMEGHT